MFQLNYLPSPSQITPFIPCTARTNFPSKSMSTQNHRYTSLIALNTTRSPPSQQHHDTLKQLKKPQLRLVSSLCIYAPNATHPHTHTHTYIYSIYKNINTHKLLKFQYQIPTDLHQIHQQPLKHTIKSHSWQYHILDPIKTT
jgi:hypothetical protein